MAPHPCATSHPALASEATCCWLLSPPTVGQEKERSAGALQKKVGRGGGEQGKQRGSVGLIGLSPDPNWNGALNIAASGLPSPGDSTWGETWLEVNTGAGKGQCRAARVWPWAALTLLSAGVLVVRWVCHRH